MREPVERRSSSDDGSIMRMLLLTRRKAKGDRGKERGERRKQHNKSKQIRIPNSPHKTPENRNRNGRRSSWSQPPRQSRYANDETHPSKYAKVTQSGV